MNKPIPGISKSIVDELSHYNFPGNIRELRNMVERAIIFCQGDRLTENDFIFKTTSAPTYAPSPDLSLFTPGEADLIREKLKSCNYNQTEAASALGITRDALIRKMKKYGIAVSRVGL